MSVPAVTPDEAAVLDIDRLDVYRVAVQFTTIVSRLRITSRLARPRGPDADPPDRSAAPRARASACAGVLTAQVETHDRA
jgi:hypothetical protein